MKKIKNYFVAKIYLWIKLYEDKLKLEEKNKLLANSKASIDQTVKVDEINFSITPDFEKISIGANVLFRKYCSILVYPKGCLIIHKNVFFNNYCSINCLDRIEIGENTIFGEGVKIYDHNHQHSYTSEGGLKVEREKFKIGSVKIGKDCWIGSNVTILNNVEIGDNVIIGANCLIYKSIPPNSIVKHKEELIIVSRSEGLKNE